MDQDVSQRWAKRENLALLTDYYQLTMMGGYWKTRRNDLEACFNYTFRELPRTPALLSPPVSSNCSTWSRISASPARTWTISRGWVRSTMPFSNI